ncbi:MAG: hypothetical protein OXO49_00230 [Gammaproteobacteria bacterium]|nr:hypothetical protein [Gammaproteobacteria bacterium]MDE0251411.1 hypothetical protein [Gammaproteobacteria bacterium]MDE0401906.1 hypothetical protein [Gammaproteobacteria bacterium]
MLSSDRISGESMNFRALFVILCIVFVGCQFTGAEVIAQTDTTTEEDVVENEEPQATADEESSADSDLDLKQEREKTLQEIPDIREKAQSLIRDFVDRSDTDQLSLEEIEAIRAELIGEQTEQMGEGESTEQTASNIPAESEASIDETLAEIPEVKDRVKDLITDFQGRNGESTEEYSEPEDSEPEEQTEEVVAPPETESE